jgi:ABC-type multidrug transport system fused ATPase/permease subunit
MIRTILQFRGFLRPYRLRLVAGSVSTLLGTLLALAQPWPLKVIIDSVIHHHRLRLPGTSFLDGAAPNTILDFAIGAFLLIVVLNAFLDYFANAMLGSAGQHATTDIRELLFARLQRLSLRFHSAQPTGDLVVRGISDVSRLQDTMVQTFTTLLPNVAFLVGVAVVMVIVDWSFALIAIVISPLLFLVALRYTPRIRRAAKRARHQEGQMAAHAGEVLGAIRVVQAFTREDFEDQRFSGESSQTLAANLEAVQLRARFGPMVDVVVGLATAAAMYIGTQRVLSGRLSLGLLVVYLSYLASLFRPIRQLSKLSYVTGPGIASAERIAQVLEAEADVRDLPDARPAPGLHGRVVFDQVEFAYTQTPVLHDISLTAEPGEVVALVGPTGAGKSTLVSLIPRFFDPQHGSVSIDGFDVRAMTLQSLRSQVAVVLQEPIVFDASVYDNIAYGRPGATDAEVFGAARAALVDEFARDLPRGYDTRLGERGTSLSGGERQRISIARALVRNAPILILDEPTSALDPASERKLLLALKNLMAGRTTLVIAHRMSTVSGAHQVLVLDHGRIVERGSHERLMRVPMGLYRSYLEAQVSQAPGRRETEVGVP